jgi:hypothetical protein
MVVHDGFVWLLKRRAKTETVNRVERVVASQLCPEVSSLFMRYLILVRPLERHLAYHLYPDRKQLGSWLSEYLWIQSGMKMTFSQATATIGLFLKKECGFKGGIRGYRQLCTQMIRVFIGSESEAKAEDYDNLANQTDPSLRKLFCANLPEGLTNAPGISSTLVRRYGRASQDWWEILGLKRGCEAMKPLRDRNGSRSSASQEDEMALLVDRVSRHLGLDI